jgi:glutamate/aspartate transport system permease protein
MQEMTFQIFEAFTAATIIYLSVNLLVVKLMGFIETRLEVPGLSIRNVR